VVAEMRFTRIAYMNGMAPGGSKTNLVMLTLFFKEDSMIKKIKAFLKHFDISAGWFKYERFQLFSITIGEDAGGSCYIVIFCIQIAKLRFRLLYI
jgi:hypothetical protein